MDGRGWEKEDVLKNGGCMGEHTSHIRAAFKAGERKEKTINILE